MLSASYLSKNHTLAIASYSGCASIIGGLPDFLSLIGLGGSGTLIGSAILIGLSTLIDIGGALPNFIRREFLPTIEFLDIPIILPIWVSAMPLSRSSKSWASIVSVHFIA